MQEQTLNERRLTEPSFHDGYLTGIEVEGETVTLRLTSHSGERFTMILNGVTGFLANEFKLGNIVFDFEIFRECAAPVSCLDQLFPPPHPGAEARFHERYAEFRRGIERRVLAGEEMVMVLNSSYGCDFSAVCRSFIIHELPRPSGG